VYERAKRSHAFLAVAVATALVFAPGYERILGHDSPPTGGADLAGRILAPTVDEAAGPDASSFGIKRKKDGQKWPRPTIQLAALAMGAFLFAFGFTRLACRDDQIVSVFLGLIPTAPRAPPLLTFS